MEAQRDPIIYGRDPDPRGEALKPGYLRLEEELVPGYHTIAKRVYHEGREYSVKFFYPKNIMKESEIENPVTNLKVRNEFKKLIDEMLEYAETFKLAEDENFISIRLQGSNLLRFNGEREYEATPLMKALDTEIGKASHEHDEDRSQRLIKLKTKAERANRIASSLIQQRIEKREKYQEWEDDFELISDKEFTPEELEQLNTNRKITKEEYDLFKEKLAKEKPKQPRPQGEPRGEIVYLAPIIEDVPPEEIEDAREFTKDYTPIPPKKEGFLDKLFGKSEKKEAPPEEPKKPLLAKSRPAAAGPAPVAPARGKKPAPPARAPEAEDAEEPAAAPPPPPPKKAGAKAPPPPPRESPKPAGKAPPPPPPPPKPAAVASAPPALEAKPAAASAPSSPPPVEDEDVELQGSGQESGEDNAKKPTVAEQNQAPAEAPAAAEASAAAEDNPMAAQLKKLKNIPKVGEKGKGKPKSTDPLLNALGNAMDSRREAFAPKSETEGDDYKKKNDGKKT